MSDKIIKNQKGNLGIITLNRPEVFNSIDKHLAISFIETLEAYRQDPSIRAIMITGTGKAFCAGQDLQETLSPDFEIDKVVDKYYNPIVKLIRAIEKPVIAAINGVAAGAGANLALACDITIATKSASFVQAFSKIGLVPDCGGTFTLPRVIGFQKASALMMLGDKVSAEDAEKMGMIYRVVEDDSFAAEAEKVAQTLANMPTKALGYTKHLLNQSMTNNLDQQLEMEKEFQFKSTQTFDNKEGIMAFVEKRKPEFKGE